MNKSFFRFRVLATTRSQYKTKRKVSLNIMKIVSFTILKESKDRKSSVSAALGSVILILGSEHLLVIRPKDS